MGPGFIAAFETAKRRFRKGNSAGSDGRPATDQAKVLLPTEGWSQVQAPRGAPPRESGRGAAAFGGRAGQASPVPFAPEPQQANELK